MKKSALVKLISIIKEEVEKEIGRRGKVIDSVPIRILTFKDVQRLYQGVNFNKGEHPNVPSTGGGAMETMFSEASFDRWKKEFVAKFGTEGELALVKDYKMQGYTDLAIIGNKRWQDMEDSYTRAATKFYSDEDEGRGILSGLRGKYWQ